MIFTWIFGSFQKHRQIYIPKGFAHGFSVLSKYAVVSYKCSAFYAPESEGSIAADDPQLGIDCHIPSEQYIRSNKDLKAASFEAYCQNPAFHFTKGCMR